MLDSIYHLTIKPFRNRVYCGQTLNFLHVYATLLQTSIHVHHECYQKL